MYEHLKGKKILIIGSDASNIAVVKTAHELEMYVIVVDSILDRKKTPSKNIADEAWDLDYSNTVEIVKRATESNIDGVFAGYSEYRVLAALKIAEAMKLPFYATEEQINLTRNKRFFKNECIKYGIKTPKDYCYNYPVSEMELNAIEYPVIVKPADYAGRKGITICYNEKNIQNAISFAVSYSKSKMVIIEEFLKGVEFSAIYTLVDGNITLSCVNEKYISDDQERQTGLCEFVITPASFIKKFEDEMNACIIDFLKGIDAKNGVAFFQGMSTAKGIYVFEMGYRVNGNNDFYVIEKNNDISFLKMLLNFSVTGSMGKGQEKDTPYFKRFYATMPLNVHAGVVEHIEYKELLKMSSFEDVQCLITEGQEIMEDGSTQQKAMSVRIVAENIDKIIECVEVVNANVKIVDKDDKNMLFKPFSPKKLMMNYQSK